MGVATLQTLRDELLFTLGGYTSGELADPRIDQWLNWAQLHIGRPAIYHHRELMTSGTFVLATNTPEYPLTGFGTSVDNVQAVRRIHYETRGHRITPMSHRQYIEAARTGSGVLLTGEPFKYTLDGPNLYLLPAPSAVYNGGTVRVFFFRKPAVLSSTPASELAQDWDEVILQGAVWRGFRALNLMERAEGAKIEFGQLINEVRDRLQAEHIEDHADRTFEVEVELHQEVG